MSQLVFPINKFGKTGKIHSIFSGSFNILVGSNLISVSKYQVYIPGHGINISENLFDEIKKNISIGDIVTFKYECIVFYSFLGIMKLDLNPVQVINLEIGPLNYDKNLVNRIIKIIEKKQLKIGLSKTTDEIKTFKFLEKNRELSFLKWKEKLLFLIGRGKGLTPSGDDLIVGYQFVNQIFDSKKADFVTEILNQNDLSTTDVSKAYIFDMKENVFCTPLYSFYRVLSESGCEINDTLLMNSIDNILKIGHTSGNDITFGIYIGLKSVIYRYGG